jgi:hypothetical protein
MHIESKLKNFGAVTIRRVGAADEFLRRTRRP